MSKAGSETTKSSYLRSHRFSLDLEDVFHTTPNPGPGLISLSLSLRQFLMPASFALKMLPVVPFLQLLELFLTCNYLSWHIET
jgi:hypothetical protein